MIILARMENTGLRKTGGVVERDRNLFEEYEEISEPHALLWCKKELEHDREKALKFAALEGYEVYDFPKGTRVNAAIEQAKVRLGGYHVTGL